MGEDLNPAGMLPQLILGGSLWAMRRDALARMLELMRGSALPAVAAPAAGPMAVQPSNDSPGVAVIPLTGVLTPHGSFISYLFGGGYDGVQGFRDQLARAVGDPSVAAIVLDVDSPGGSVGLVAEAAADVRAARDIKPIYAVANCQAASGAYWIASQATELYCTPSGMVGSVGVYYVHEDWSAANEQAGVDVTYIYAGQYKVEGNPDNPLSDEAKAAWQADADTLYGMFVADVAAGRGASTATVTADYGQGRCLLASDAEAAGMVDGTDTIQTVIARALSEAATSTGASARRLGHATVLRREARADSTPDSAPEAPDAPVPAVETPDAPENDPTHVPNPAPDLEPDPPVEPEPDTGPAADPEALRIRVDALLQAS